MDKVLLSREDISKRWGITVQSVINYENSGVITRVKAIPIPRYRFDEILKIEGEKLNAMSPLERSRLVNENRKLREENELLKIQLQKFAMLGTESISLLSENKL